MGHFTGKMETIKFSIFPLWGTLPEKCSAMFPMDQSVKQCSAMLPIELSSVDKCSVKWQVTSVH